MQWGSCVQHDIPEKNFYNENTTFEEYPARAYDARHRD